MSIFAILSVTKGAPQDKLVRQWDLRSSGCATQMWTSQPVYAVAAHPDGHTVAAGDESGSLTFFDVRNGGVLGSLPNLHHDTVRALSFPGSGDSPVHEACFRVCKTNPGRFLALIWRCCTMRCKGV